MKRIWIAITIAVAILACGVWTAYFLATPGRPADASFEVQPGESAEAVADRLAERGFVRSRAIFRYVLQAAGYDKAIQPGRYDLSGVATYRDLAERLTRGGVSAQEFVLLIKEGDDLRDVRQRLKELGYAGADGLYEVTGEPALDYRGNAAKPEPPDFSKDFPFLKGKPGYVGLEGYLFPDTYRLPRAAKPEEIVRRLLANFGRKLDGDLAESVAKSGRPLFDIVTMASILEKEVRSDRDRRLAADILWRRLAEKMPLQVDSSVNYATGGSKPAVGQAELAVDSRYNTYKYGGLPAGPIGNPGLAAIKAAADPLPNEWWYFLTDADGTVHYAKTLQEHAANKARYLR